MDPWTIVEVMGGAVGALALAIAAMAAYIVKLHRRLEKCQDQRSRDLKDQLSLLETLDKEVDKVGGGK